MSQEDRERWNARHAGATAHRGPADWVGAHRDLLEAQQPGRALDVACGLGRNALFLAELGFAVDALDVSDVAVKRLRAAATERGLDVRARQADLREAPQLERGVFDVVVCTFFLHRPLLPAMAAALAPGGLLLMETFTTAQAGRDRGPSDPDRLLRPGELRAAFERLEVLDAQEGEREGMALAGVVARRAA